MNAYSFRCFSPGASCYRQGIYRSHFLVIKYCRWLRLQYEIPSLPAICLIYIENNFLLWLVFFFVKETICMMCSYLPNFSKTDESWDKR
ncbi:hypothetical protein XELAEV_18045197mg [Xenopus laevis]|uniref:Uncharacterized protein n=1 Tax=Xenopus laevis TaxID=8355 RepID=A0A974C0W4_XENLA|nr:hypothetical protein XELAEV_18045197mg [Xenopus laevis]